MIGSSLGRKDPPAPCPVLTVDSPTPTARVGSQGEHRPHRAEGAAGSSSMSPRAAACVGCAGLADAATYPEAPQSRLSIPGSLKAVRALIREPQSPGDQPWPGENRQPRKSRVQSHPCPRHLASEAPECTWHGAEEIAQIASLPGTTPGAGAGGTGDPPTCSGRRWNWPRSLGGGGGGDARLPNPFLCWNFQAE